MTPVSHRTLQAVEDERERDGVEGERKRAESESEERKIERKQIEGRQRGLCPLRATSGDEPKGCYDNRTGFPSQN